MVNGLRTKERIRLSDITSFCALIISIATLIFSYYCWHRDNSASISVSGHFQAETGSYEDYVYSDRGVDNRECGRFLITGTVTIANFSTQGCILKGSVLLDETNDNAVSVSDYWSNNIYTMGDMFEDVYIAGKASISIPIQIFFYVDEELHQTLKAIYGDSLQEQSIETLILNLYLNESIIISYNTRFLTIEDNTAEYSDLPETSGIPVLMVTTNTGAKAYTVISFSPLDTIEHLESLKS